MGGGTLLLAEREWSTGAVVVSEALPDAVLAHLERDVNHIIDAFDGGNEPPARPGSLTSGARAWLVFTHLHFFFLFFFFFVGSNEARPQSLALRCSKTDPLSLFR